jgi:hypothetical protein
MKLAILPAIMLAWCGLFLTTSASAQAPRDYFTDEEIEMIRDAQAIDERIGVLTHAIDRRFSVLKVGVGESETREKKTDNWGPLPTGTRVELLSDIKNILQKAIDDIDNLSENPNSAPLPDEHEKKPKATSNLFPKAVRKLASAAKRYEPALKAQLDAAKDDHEKGVIMDSLDMCDEIIQSVAKLPAETQKKSAKDR